MQQTPNLSWDAGVVMLKRQAGLETSVPNSLSF